MSKTLIIGNEEFQYPETGTNPSENWGDEASNWAEAVTDVLADVFAPSDITLTSFSLNDNQVVPANIVGLKFSTAAILSVKVDYIIQRIVALGDVRTESGTIIGNFNGTDFFISRDCCGDTQIDIDVTPTGQFYYTSNNLGHISCIIKFKASTIAN